MRLKNVFIFTLIFWILSSPVDRTDVSYPPMIETINLLEPSADFLAPGDRIHQVDGVSTVGLTNDQVMTMLLCNRDENAVIEIEYSLPDYRECNWRLDRKCFTNFFPSYHSKQFHKIACASPQNWHKSLSNVKMDALVWRFAAGQKCRSSWQMFVLMDLLIRQVELSLAIECCELITWVFFKIWN